ncbi:DUF2231 domain-containing protein [Flavicella marina]|uniref:DUF2231 domain-containing protein n=1 Tax=Flavicella marina TaxID=1475951 RepID=UPI001264C449|nr:DUF2231 domain-containing protein [Flavicella marina]
MFEVPDFVIFLGRFHPLLVHLPIGFLLFAFILEIYARWKKINEFDKAISFALLLGTLGAIAASVLGYMLSLSGGYSVEMLDQHFWFAVTTIVVSLVAWVLKQNILNLRFMNQSNVHVLLSVLVVICISVTGHLGGNLTHGSEYLLEYAPIGRPVKIVLQPVNDVNEAQLYGHLVEPILKEKCLSCHNESKLKGELSLKDSISIFTGGKHGNTIVAGNAATSELYKRVLLDPHDKKFMPPEGKPGLTDEEKEIVAFWINEGGADFSKKISEVESSEKQIEIASSFLGLDAKSIGDKLPNVAMVDKTLMLKLKDEGFVFRELVFESNLYDVVLPPSSATSEELLLKKIKMLSEVKSNVLWLSLEENFVSDEAVQILAEFEHIQKLAVQNNNISDKSIEYLSKNMAIKSLNLFKTNVSKKCIPYLIKMESLKRVYLWQTNFTKDEINTSNEEMPTVQFISGV